MVEPTHEQLRQLLAYWRRKKGDRLAPSRGDIDPTDIPHLLPYIGIAEVQGDPPRFRYRLVGSHIVRGYGAEITGRFLDECDLDLHEADIIAEYAQAAAQAVPICSRWEYNRRDGRHVRYERLVLPLSSDGARVDMLIGGCVFDQAFG